MTITEKEKMGYLSFVTTTKIQHEEVPVMVMNEMEEIKTFLYTEQGRHMDPTYNTGIPTHRVHSPFPEDYF